MTQEEQDKVFIAYCTGAISQRQFKEVVSMLSWPERFEMAARIEEIRRQKETEEAH